MAIDTSKIDLNGLTSETVETTNQGGIIDPTTTLRRAIKESPDGAALNLQISETTGLSMDAVRTAPEAARQRFNLEKINLEGLRERAPATAESLKDFNVAAIAHDDTENLADIEASVLDYFGATLSGVGDGVTYAGDTGRAFLSGPIQYLGMGLSGIGRALDSGGRLLEDAMWPLVEATGADSVITRSRDYDGVPYPAKIFTDTGGDTKAAAKFVAPKETDLFQDMTQGLGQLLGQAGLVAASPAAGTALLFGSGADQQRDRQIQSGAERTTLSDAGVLAGGLVTMGTERIAIDNLLQRLPPSIKNSVARRITDIAIAGGVEAAQEVVEGLSQDLIEYLTSNDEVQWAQGADREAIVAGGAGAMARAILQIAFPGRVGGPSRAVMDQIENDSIAAEMEKSFGDKVTKAAIDSKLRQRAPEVFRQILDNAGGRDARVHIDAAQLSLYLREVPQADRGTASYKTLVAAAKSADQADYEVSLSLSDFLTTVAPSEHLEPLRTLISFNENVAPEFRREQSRAETRRSLDQMVAEANKDSSAFAEAQDIFDTVKDQLVDSGVYNPSMASELSKIVPAWAVARSKRTGQTVAEVFESSGLTIKGPMTGRRKALGDGTLLNSDERGDSYEQSEREQSESNSGPATPAPGQATGREDDGSLAGLPRKPEKFGRPAASRTIRDVAAGYMESRGLGYEPPALYAKVNPERAKRIADEYERMEHDPHNPEVKAAYDALVEETVAQYRAALAAGLQVEFINFEETGDPYAESPRMANQDIVENNHMWVFATSDGFGSSEFDPSENPLLGETEFTDVNGKPMLVNDLFRVVHDYFGHAKEGVGFRADGEENAWRAHAAMFSPLARRALTTETRGQNSWVNFGPFGEQNRTASAEDTVFADQKTGLMPEWVSTEAAGDSDLFDSEGEKFFQRGEEPLPRDKNGLFSPMQKALREMNLPQWGRKGSGFAKGKDIFDKLRKSPGVKAEELKWTYLEEALTGPFAEVKLSRGDVIELATGDFVKIDPVVRADSVEEFSADELRSMAVRRDEGGRSIWNIEGAEFTARVYSFEGEDVDGEPAEVFYYDLEVAGQTPHIGETWDEPETDDYFVWERLADDIANSVGDTTRHSEFVAEGTHTNYRETLLTFNSDKLIGEVLVDAHWDESNVIAWVRSTDRRIETAPAREAQVETRESVKISFRPTEGAEADWTGTIRGGVEVLDDTGARIAVLDAPSKFDTVQEYIDSVLMKTFNDPDKVGATARTPAADLTLKGPLTVDAHIRKEVASPAEFADALFVEEVQSDWHQKGSRGGYRTSETDAIHQEQLDALNEDIDAVRAQIDAVFLRADGSHTPLAEDLISYVTEKVPGANISFDRDTISAFIQVIERHDEDPESKARVVKWGDLDTSAWATNFIRREAAREVYIPMKDLNSRYSSRRDLILKNKKRVPDAPFKKTWVRLTAKRALMDAIKRQNGALAWAAASTHHERWGNRPIFDVVYDREMVKEVKALTGQEPEYVKDSEFGSYWYVPLPRSERQRISDEGVSMFQRGAETARGYYAPEQNLIRMTEAADASTFLHEFAHFMFETEVKEESGLFIETLHWLMENKESLAEEASRYYNREGDDLEQSAFSGSRADFDEFSTDFVGSGRNGSAYGWGIYFTHEGIIARGYADEGVLYEADIPETDQMMVHELSLAKQPDAVREAVYGLLEKYPLETKRDVVRVDGVPTGPGALGASKYAAAMTVARFGYDKALRRQMDAVADNESMGWTNTVADEKLAYLMSLEGKTVTVDRETIPSDPEVVTAGDLYESMARHLGSPEAASLALLEAGIPGLSYSPHTFRQEDRLNFVVWDDNAIEILSKKSAEEFKQDYSGELPGIGPATITPGQVAEYLVEGTTGDEKVDKAIRIATHEQFARAFESYVMEGNAPSIELRNAFQRFARWLAEIYRSIRGDLGVKLNDDIRRVFDRLLATEDQIAAAKARTKFEPLFTDAAMAGMTQEDYEKYQESVEKVSDTAAETLREKVMKEVTRTAQSWWRQEKQEIIQEITPSIQRERVHRTRARLLDDWKLDRAAVKEMVGQVRVSKKGEDFVTVPPKLRGMTATGGDGSHPDIVASLAGYSSGREMLDEIMSAPSVAAEAERRAENLMVAEHGDVLNDGSLERQADEIMQNESRTELILQELRSLRRGTGEAETKASAMRGLAKERVAKMSFREMNPGRFRRAEVRSAQEAGAALASGNRAGAVAAKERQLMNRMLAEESQKAREAIEKVVDKASRYSKKSVREAIQKSDGGHLDQIDKILSRFDLRKSATKKSVDEKNIAVQAWMEERIRDFGDGLILTPAVLDEAFVSHWKDVAFGELQGVWDSVRNIEHVARYSNKITVAEEQVEFDELVDRWVAGIEKNPKVHTATRRTVAEGKKFIPWAMSQMTKIPWMASWLDGGERVGLSHSILMEPFNIAFDEKIRLWKVAGKPVIDAIENRTAEDIKRHGALVHIPEIQDSLYGHQILSVALNVGNQGNLKKLLLGEGWADPDDADSVSLENPKLKAVLAHMSRSDWELVQMIWDQMDLLYPRMAEVHRATTGVTPPKVEATPVTTPFGEFAGGYYPVKYDPERDFRAAENQDKADAQTDSLFGGENSLQASVNTGATEARTGYYAPIRLHLDVVPNHFDEVIHFITHHDAVRQTNRIIRDGRVRKAISDRLGPFEFKQLRPWLNDIAKDGRESSAKFYWETAFNRLRTGATLGYMGFKASTGLMQLLGLSNAAAEVGAVNIIRAFRQNVGSISTMQKSMEFAVDMGSRTMQHRASTFDRDVRAALNSIEKESGVFRAVQEASMKHIALIQTYIVDLPTWHAAYAKELKASGDESRAVKYADWTVENVHGSGIAKDMAAIMRSRKESDRIFTMFMTFFSALWNNQRDLARGARNKTLSKTDVAARAMFLFVVPVIGEMLLRGDFGDEDDDETLMEKAALKVALYPTASIPFIRDVANGVGGDFGYSMSPVGSLLESGVEKIPETVKATLTDDDLTRSAAKGTYTFMGAWFRVPGTSQAWATTEHLYKVAAEGEDLTLKELIYGPDWE